MWHVPGGDRSFTGPYSLLLAYGLSEIIERLTFCYEENDDEHRFGYKAFANLTLEQKAWTIHQVAFGLLDEKTPIVPLVAFNEAAIASIFPALEDLVSMEIDSTRETPRRTRGNGDGAMPCGGQSMPSMKRTAVIHRNPLMAPRR